VRPPSFYGKRQSPGSMNFPLLNIFAAAAARHGGGRPLPPKITN
jgi:hypothetical protein